MREFVVVPEVAGSAGAEIVPCELGGAGEGEKERKGVMEGGGEKRMYPLMATEYKLLEEIGQGVSAIVYRAMCLPFKEVVAIKALDLEKCNCNLVLVFCTLRGWILEFGDAGSGMSRISAEVGSVASLIFERFHLRQPFSCAYSSASRLTGCVSSWKRSRS